MVLIRMIERNKWTKHIDIYKEEGKIASFPVTNDLITCKANTLSVWEADIDTQDSVEKTVLTIASSRQHLQDLDVSIIDMSKLESNGVNLENNIGITDLDEFKNRHWDLKNLDIDNIKTISKEILDYICNSNEDDYTKRIRYNKGALIKLYIKYIEKGDIKLTDLKESFKEKIEMRMN